MRYISQKVILSHCFRHNDEYGTVVIQENDLAEYSEQGRKNVLQCGAKTVVCAAMYCEGSYTGAIAT